MKSCQPTEMGLMRHGFNSTLQVTGLRDAIPLAPPLTSPNNTPIHTHRSKKQELVKVKKKKKKTEEKAEEARRKWDVSKIKETGNWVKVKKCGNAAST